MCPCLFAACVDDERTRVHFFMHVLVSSYMLVFARVLVLVRVLILVHVVVCEQICAVKITKVKACKEEHHLGLVLGRWHANEVCNPPSSVCSLSSKVHTKEGRRKACRHSSQRQHFTKILDGDTITRNSEKLADVFQ